MRRVPEILQSDVAECGAACVAMIARHLGVDIDFETLRATHPLSSRGATLETLLLMSESVGLQGTPARIDLEVLRDCDGPLLLHWGMNHFVVFERCTKGGMQIVDPAVGRRSISWEIASSKFTGIAVEFDRRVGFASAVKAQNASSVRELLPPFAQYRGEIVRLVLLALLLEAFAMLGPLLIQLVVDRGMSTPDASIVILLASGFSLILLVQAALFWARSRVLATLGLRFATQLSERVFSVLIRQPARFFETRRFGDISARYGSADVIATTLRRGFLEGLVDSSLALGMAILMLMYSWKASMVTLLALGTYIAVKAKAAGPIRDANQEALTYFSKVQSHFSETIRGIQSIKVYGVEGRREASFHTYLLGRAKAEHEIEGVMTNGRTAVTLIFGLEQIVVITLLAMSVQLQAITLGMLFAFLAFRAQFVARASNLIDRASDMIMLRQHFGRLAEIANVSTTEAAGRSSATQSPVAVSMSNVVFRYGEFEAPVLDGASLNIRWGERVAVTGISGAGKSTLLKIVSGLLRPQHGEVQVSGVPIHELGRSNGGLAVVLQDDYLFMGSITDNIAFFDRDPDLSRVIESARLANIHDDIERMPMGYRTLIGDLGNSVSGGQRQRLLLARALYRKPSILLLDEATSHLDPAAERAISQSLRQSGMTMLIVAHRDESIRLCDRVYVLSDGRLREVASSYSAALSQ